MKEFTFQLIIPSKLHNRGAFHNKKVYSIGYTQKGHYLIEVGVRLTDDSKNT